MAGFDAEFRFLPGDRGIVLALFAAIRRRARVLFVRTTSAVGDGIAYIGLDGNTYQLDFLLERMRRDLQTIAEATHSSTRSPKRRRALALGLIDILWRSRLSAYDRYPEGWVPTLRATSAPAYLFPHDLFTPGAPSLQGRMSVTMEMLSSWHFDEVAPEVLLEEVHTAIELLLRHSVVSAQDRMKYPDLVKAARREGVIQCRPDLTNLSSKVRAKLPTLTTLEQREFAQDYARDLLLQLSATRNPARHNGASGAKQWFDAHFWEVTRVLERLSAVARDRDVASP